MKTIAFVFVLMIPFSLFAASGGRGTGVNLPSLSAVKGQLQENSSQKANNQDKACNCNEGCNCGDKGSKSGN